MMNPTPLTKHRRASRPRRLAASVLLAVAPFVSLSCGKATPVSNAQASSSEQATQNGADSQSTDEFEKCLADNGIELGTPPADDGAPAAEDGTAPTSGDGTPPASDDARRQAQEACGDLMPRGEGGGPQGGGMNSEALQKWTACLAENGVELDLPTPGAGGPGGSGDAAGERPEMPADGERPQPPADGERPGGGTPFGLDTSDPDVAAAVTKCESLQPQMGGRSGQGATTTTQAAAES